jgi:hypothetical protein
MKRDFKSITQEIEECPFCSSMHSFEYKSASCVWRWDITLPEDWRFGDWGHVQLAPQQVPLPIVKCNACGKSVRIIPAFMVEGTTLTLSALIFLAFVYENTPLVWRSLPEKFCKEGDKIAHSTIYRAVHGLGKNLLEGEDVRELYAQWNVSISLPPNTPQTAVTAWPPKKSRYPHTQHREEAVRDLLTLFLCIIKECAGFIDLFLRFMERIRMLFSQMVRPVQKLYTRYKRKYADTS